MGDGFQLPVQPQYVYTFHFMSTIDVVKLYCNALGVNYNITFFLLCWPFWKIKSKRDRKKPIPQLKVLRPCNCDNMRTYCCGDILTFQTGKVVGLRLDCTDSEFSRQCVKDAMYANEHNQTSGQRWLERRRKRRRWRYDGVRRRCAMTTEERRSVKAEGLVDSFPTRNCLQGSR